MAAPRRRRRGARQPHQRLVPVAQPQQALARRRPEEPRRQGGAARPREDRRRVPAELPAGRRRPPRRRLRDACEDQPAARLRVDVGLRRGRPLPRPPGTGPDPAGHVRRHAVGRARRRAADAGRPVPRRRDHRLHRLRGRARSTAPPRAHRRGATRAGQHAGRHRDDPDAGAVGVHRRRQAADPLCRAARPRLHPRPLRRVRDERRLHHRRLPVAEEARRGDRRAGLPRDGRRDRQLDAARRDLRPYTRQAEDAHQRRVAGGAARRRHLGRPRLRLRRPRRRPAGRPQRHLRHLRPSDRGSRHHAGLPDPLLQDALHRRPRRAARRRAYARVARRARLRRS
eukprot:Opistho-1_new@29420